MSSSKIQVYDKYGRPVVAGADFVKGPASTPITDSTIALWDGTTGRLIKSTTAAIDGSGHLQNVIVDLNWIDVDAAAPNRFLTRDGSGNVVDTADPSLTNLTHDHTNDANGGTLPASAIVSGTFDAARIPALSYISTVKEAGASVVTSADTLDFKESNVEDLGSGDAAIYQNHSALAGGRLTLTTAVPVTTSDVTAAGTLYYTPYIHDEISIYDGTRLKNYHFTELSLSLSGLTTTAPYDIFIYDNAGTLTLEALAWASNTARNTAIVRQNGYWAKSGATTRRLVGTIKMSATSQCEDSVLKRFVWNADNRVGRLVEKRPSGNWNSTNTAWHQWNASSANQVEFVAGLEAEPACVLCGCQVTTITVAMGIGFDRTNGNDAFPNGYSVAGQGAGYAYYNAVPTIGYHYLALLAKLSAAGTATLFGVTADANYGLAGHVWG